MRLSWRDFFQVLNDIAQVFEGRERYYKILKAVRTIERWYRKEPETAEQRSAELIAQVCSESGATWVKFAQYLSCRPDILPEAYVQALSELQSMPTKDNVVPFSEVMPTLRNAWGTNWEMKFSRFDLVPIASASIAQVYRASLKYASDERSNSGLVVAIKVRTPGVDVLFQQDAIVFRSLAKCLSPFLKDLDIQGIVQEIIEATLLELDFANECNNLVQYNSLNQKHGIRGPEVVSALSNEQVLVTDWLDGVPLQAYLIRESKLDSAQAAAALAALSTAMLEDIFIHGVFHGDPHPGNVIVMSKDQAQATEATTVAVRLVDFGTVGQLTSQQRGQYMILMLALMGFGDHSDFAQLFRAAQFEAKDDAIFHQVGEYVQQLQGDDSVEVDQRFNEILKTFRRSQVVLPKGFIAILRVLILLGGQFKRTPLSFTDVFRQFSGRSDSDSQVRLTNESPA